MGMDLQIEKDYCIENKVNIPEYTLESILNYVNTKVPTGDFLYAVLTNNLTEAIFRADLNNSRALKDIVKYCFWRIPHNCWGSKKEVEDWVNRGDAKK